MEKEIRDDTVSTLDLVKANLGITAAVRDDYLKAIITGVEKELAGKGVVINQDGDSLMLVVDYASWQYRSRGEGVMPRNIRYRLNNLIAKGMLADG